MDAESLHRRLYGLALLLTGRPDRARLHAHAVAATTRRRRGPITLAPGSADLLERQVLLACRRDRVVSAAGLDPAFERLEGLPRQFREAFVLVRVLGRSLREAARAMDCSRTAVRRHLGLADAAVLAAFQLTAAPAPGDSAAPVGQLADIVSDLRGAMRRAAPGPMGGSVAADPRRRVVRRLIILAAIVTVVLLAWRLGSGLRSASERPADEATATAPRAEPAPEQP
jgi:hypothetical protein